MATVEHLYLPYYDGKHELPGYPSCARAKEHLSRYILVNRLKRPPLVVGYPEKDSDGMRAEYYDWSATAWKKTPLDYRGAYFVARHEAQKNS
ncbi:MAG: hypothetical protein ABI905_01540 [Betaproteobacteria bacterium]